MKKIILALAATVALTSAAYAQQKTIKLATEGAYEPFNSVGKSGKVEGFDIEVGDALCAAMKAKCEWVTADFDGAIESLKAKKFDAYIAQMSITEKRKAEVAFAGPYSNTPARLVAKKGSGIKPTVEGLKGKTVGVQRSTIHADYIEQKLKGVKVNSYATQDDANADLANGRIDAILADSAVMYDWMQKQGKGKYEFAGDPIIDEKIFGVGTGIAVRKEDTALLKEINAALKVITDNGTYKKINDKYFPFSIRGKTAPDFQG